MVVYDKREEKPLSSVPQIVHWSVGEQISETVSPVLFEGFCS